MIVSNSTILIYLSKIDKLFLLKELFKTVFIPQEVKKEVIDQGKKHNHIDAMGVEKAVNEDQKCVRLRVINHIPEYAPAAFCQFFIPIHLEDPITGGIID